MTTSTYQLAEDVFSCLSHKRIVFLDLRRNQYLCLNESDTRAAIYLLTDSDVNDSSRSGGKPLGTKPATEGAADDESTRAVIQALTNRGLLTQRGENEREASSPHVQTPENVLFPAGRWPKPVICPGHWATFIKASLIASFKLRRYSMQRTVYGIKSRKRRHYNRSQTADQDSLRELVTVFHHLRPYYARKYLCLYDSLALIEFLAHYRLFPQWVFGVTAEPFGAHCWVQEKDCVLNDAVEYARGFTPIMAI